MMADVPTARYEFRAFMSELKGLADHLYPYIHGCEWEESDEIYIVSSKDEVHNVKLRDGQVDIKTLVHEERGLEQWQPSLKVAFPLSAASIRDDVWPALNVSLPHLQRDSYTQDQYLAELIHPHLDLQAVPLHKRRCRFDVHACQAEQAEVRFHGSQLQTVAVESTSVEAVIAVKAKLGLDAYTNVNYVSAIKQTIGVTADRLSR
jgi:hypothetical protein